MAPVGVKQEAQEAKASWTDNEFRSDPLAAVRAYDAWWNLHSRREYSEANSFCSKNFLSKPTLLMMQKVKAALLQALFSAGVIEVSAGGRVSTSPVVSSQFSRGRHFAVPPELNIYSNSLPVMAGLIDLDSQPNFAIRTSDRVYRTPQDKVLPKVALFLISISHESCVPP
jgi:small subunit ribosomal protein S24e